MKLLSFSINFHDSSISYFDGKKIRYYKHERICQEKHSKLTSIEQVMGIVKEIWNLDFSDLDAISAYLEDTSYDEAIYQNTENYIVTSSFIYNTNLDLEFGETLQINKKLIKKYNIQRVDHHLCHYLSAKFLTNKHVDYGFILDGEGEPNVCGSIYKNSECISTMLSDREGSLGAFMEKLALECGIKSSQIIDGPGKLMSFQSYGEFNCELYNIISNHSILSINELHDLVFNKKFLSKYTKKDLAKTLHTFIGERILDLFKFYAAPDDNIIYSGGVAQNIVWNTQLRKSFPNIIIPPYSSDEGLSLGALRYLMEKYECI
jgi:carbamoyltransferase